MIFDKVELEDAEILYDLLGERTEDQSISHKSMPEYHDHREFVANHPYKYWYLISNDCGVLGAVYLTYNNEIGVGIFKAHQGRGYGKQAIIKIMEMNKGPFLANINPNNPRSIRMFEDLEFKHIQNTYELC